VFAKYQLLAFLISCNLLRIIHLLLLQWCWIVRLTNRATLVSLSWFTANRQSLILLSWTPTFVSRAEKLRVRQPSCHYDDFYDDIGSRDSRHSSMFHVTLLTCAS